MRCLHSDNAQARLCDDSIGITTGHVYRGTGKGMRSGESIVANPVPYQTIDERRPALNQPVETVDYRRQINRAGRNLTPSHLQRDRRHAWATGYARGIDITLGLTAD